MNSQPTGDRTAPAYVAGILGCFLIVAALVWAMRYYTQPPPLGEDRIALRKKAPRGASRCRSRRAEYLRLA